MNNAGPSLSKVLATKEEFLLMMEIKTKSEAVQFDMNKHFHSVFQQHIRSLSYPFVDFIFFRQRGNASSVR